jgi:hypothetical protein
MAKIKVMAGVQLLEHEARMQIFGMLHTVEWYLLHL